MTTPLSPYDMGLDRNAANDAPLTPLSFLAWSARVCPERVAVVQGERRFTWAETDARARRLASALASRGVATGDTVAALLPNIPEMYEAHFGVPMVLPVDHRGAEGYLKNPSRTAKAFAGGWFHSGDLAFTHPDGYMKIKDRAKDIIISGGENISSLEVEDALHRHPAVFAAAVVAEPNEKWGETPCAFVELKPDASVTEAELIAHCRELLAHFKAPRRIVFGPLPKTSTGKIQKYVLREQVRSTEAIA